MIIIKLLLGFTQPTNSAEGNMTKCHISREGIRRILPQQKKTPKGLNWLGQDVEVRTFKIAKWLTDNIESVDLISFNQKLKTIII